MICLAERVSVSKLKWLRKNPQNKIRTFLLHIFEFKINLTFFFKNITFPYIMKINMTDYTQYKHFKIL